jgi:Raf kinase inhibitor-like YbhB/YbcL family protein
MTLTLTSSAFSDGERIPKRYTCDGEDLSPPLSWSGAPDGTVSFAVICDDPDAPMGTWHHWAAYDIPAEFTELQEDFPTEPRIGAVRQAITDFGQTGYGGPCPPEGHGTHHYNFRLLALEVKHLDLPADAKCEDVEKAAQPYILAKAELTGTYSR